MTVKELKKALEKIPDDMIVAVHERTAEAPGFVTKVKICDGHEDLPYDKADNLYRQGHEAVKNGETKILIIHAAYGG